MLINLAVIAGSGPVDDDDAIIWPRAESKDGDDNIIWPRTEAADGDDDIIWPRED